MIITLKGADFSSNNIGKLSTWTIFTTLGSGTTYEGVRMVDKGASFSALITLADGYEIGSAGVKVMMGSNNVTTSAVTIEGNEIAISISAVTGHIMITVPTININTGEEEIIPDSNLVIFDFNFASYDLNYYVNQGIITIPSTSKTDTVTYDTKGISTTSTATPACLGNGVKLVTPFDIGSTDWTFEVTMTLDPWQESFGMSETLYKNLIFVSADDHDTNTEYTHGSNCLAPAVYIDMGGLSLRGPDNGGTIKKAGSLFEPDGIEHTYKLSYLKDADELVYYKDGIQKQKLSATGAVGGTIQYLLGAHNGYSSAKNFAIKMGMHIKTIKLYKV